MALTEQIYSALQASKNPAADEVLTLGLRWAEPAYKKRLLETAIRRDSQQSLQALIATYHKLPQSLREQIHCQCRKLFIALRRSCHQTGAQTRLNVLHIIQHCRLFGLADAVVVLLHDKQSQVSRLAGETLLEMTRDYVRQNADKMEPLHNRQTETGSASQTKSAYDYLFGALRSGLEQYGKTHRSQEAIVAAMIFADATQSHFWLHHCEPYQASGVAVRKTLEETGNPELANFLLSALANRSLRPLAVRKLGKRLAPEMVQGLARSFGQSGRSGVSEGLRRIRQPAWLDHQHLPLEELSGEDQILLLEFIRHLGCEPDTFAKYLDDAMNSLRDPVLEKVIDILGEMPAVCAEKMLERALQSGSEIVSLKALQGLMRQKSSRLPKLLVGQLRSPHARLREIARKYYQKIAFNSFWRNYYKLTHQERIAAGRAVMKLDPQSPSRWRQLAMSGNPETRLQAVLMARELGQGCYCLDVFERLLHDSDSRVRSCAIAGIGEIRQLKRKKVEEHLVRALDDPDWRVKANAVEALEKRDREDLAAEVAVHMYSPNSRLRANAIKAMLNWRAESARRAVEEMLVDPRPDHRRSAGWLLGKFADSGEGQNMKQKEKVSHELAVSV